MLRSVTPARPIQSLPAAERPRERLLAQGPDGLSTVELLAILIGSGHRSRSALVIAHELFSETPSLGTLVRLEPLELARRTGIGPSRAARIMAGLTLGRRSLLPSEPRDRVHTPEDAAELLLPHYQHQSREHFGVLLLDSRHGVIARQTVTIGSLDRSLVHPREVFRPAIVHRAARIVLFHNHPSGDPSPSPEDLALTRRLVEVGQTLGIEVLDHIVLGDGIFESLRESRTGTAGFEDGV